MGKGDHENLLRVPEKGDTKSTTGNAFKGFPVTQEEKRRMFRNIDIGAQKF